MSLAAGARLGVYEIESALGAGGMGEVYRARDTKLGRLVALKLILDVFASNSERIARFEREAKVLAAINHPHIAALYGMEEDGGRHFLVMELVEGETLGDRLLHGPLPVEEALRIAIQIAEALESAHEKGIVHRDLKPANVKITPDDRVKVLDFGLAKAMESDNAAANVANSPTLSMMASQAGVILGTAAYMSPEQAKGLAADHRSDVFSFGIVVYEMLTGRKPFHGDTVPEVLASVLVREADISSLPANLNPRLTDLVRRCLEKNPKRRWHAMGDVRAELEFIAASPAVAVATSGRRSLWTRALVPIVASLVVGVLAAAAAWMLKPQAPRRVMQFAIAMPESQRFTSVGRSVLTIAADGSRFAYVADRRLYLRRFSEPAVKPIPGSDSIQGLTSPTFSPDGESIAFYVQGEQVLKRIGVDGGTSITICPAANPFGMSWDKQGILFAQGDTDTHGIMRVSANGGKPEFVIKVESAEIAYGPQMLPDGQTILFTLAPVAGADRWEKARIVAQSLRDGRRKVLVEGGSDARLLPDGHLVYAIAGSVFGVDFDAQRLEVTSGPVPLIEGVRRSGAMVTGAAQFAVADDGTLIYVPGPLATSASVYKLAIADRKGAIVPLPVPEGAYHYPRASRDGKRIAFTVDDGKDAYIAVYDLTTAHAMQRITFGGHNRYAVWSPDGKRLAFQSDREGDLGIFTQAADGTGPAERLTRPAAQEAHVPDDWSPDGRFLLFDATKDQTTTVWALSMADRRAARFDGIEGAIPSGAVFSFDGRWVAYATNDKQATNLFVQPFPATGAQYELPKPDRSGPHHPMWTPDGSGLYTLPSPGTFVMVPVVTHGGFAFGNPSDVPRDFDGAPPSALRPYDMMPDGRFLCLVAPGQTPSSSLQPRVEISVVLNWFEQLKTRMPR